MAKDPNRPFQCADPPQPETETLRSYAYATSSFDILSYRQDGYDLIGIEGYLIDPSQSAPPGTVTMHRVFRPSTPQHPNAEDWAIVPANELAGLSGYSAKAPYSEIIGHAYPNVDTDGDGMIDGLESIVGTDPNDADSDEDGLSDGAELLGLGGGSLSDPLVAAPEIFDDGFETGDTTKWSATIG